MKPRHSMVRPAKSIGIEAEIWENVAALEAVRTILAEYLPL
jgi:hypothetical protein